MVNDCDNFSPLIGSYTCLLFYYPGIAVIVMFWAMRYNEKHGHWPLLKAKKAEPEELEEIEEEILVDIEEDHEMKDRTITTAVARSTTNTVKEEIEIGF